MAIFYVALAWPISLLILSVLSFLAGRLALLLADHGLLPTL
jgi:hypothetical protein